MIETLRLSFYKNGYLLIIAAWLFTISFIITNYWSYTSSPQQVKESFDRYMIRSEKSFDRFSNDSVFISSILRETGDENITLKYNENEVAFFIYTPNDIGNLLLRYWNSNKVLPTPADLQKPDGKSFSTYANGEFEFIKRTANVSGQRIVTVALVPLRWNYFFENKYLKTEFAFLKGLEKRYGIVSDSTKADFFVGNVAGNPIFGIREKGKYNDRGQNMWALAFKVLAVIFVLVFINAVSGNVAQHKGWLRGFSFLSGIILIARIISYWSPFPFDYSQLDLFDPGIYASNRFHPSLGDLLINVILVFWLVSFIKQAALQYISEHVFFTGFKAKVFIVICSVVLVLLSFTSAGIIRSLINDSKIPFDVINFFGLNIYTLISFIILCFITLTFYHVSHMLLLLINSCRQVEGYFKYMAVAIVGLLYLTLLLQVPTLRSNLFVLLWLLIFIAILEFRKEDVFIPLIRSSFFLVWMIFFASSISILIIFQNSKMEYEQRKRIAEKLVMQTDPSAENLMSIGFSNFNNLFLSENFYRMKSDIGNKLIKDSLINENFSGYLNKYDTRIYTFDSLKNPLYNDDSTSFEVITNIITTESKPTTIPNVYYYEKSYDYFSYLYKKEVKNREGEMLGYFFVDAKPKKYKSEALYPELFKQVKDISTDLDVNYAYAVYSNGELINHFGDYDFVSRIPKSRIPKQEFKEFNNGEYNELWHNAGNNKLVIVIKSGTVFLEAVTLFAYLFGAFLFVIIVIQIGRFVILTRFRWKKMKMAFRFNIRSQIQSTIIFISVFSFVVIGIATISFYIKRYNKNNRERLLKAVQVMSTEIQSQISTHAIFDDVVRIYDIGASSKLERTINEISKMHSVDVNFYDKDGVLQVSTQPYIYNKQILSEMMEPTAYYRLHFNHEIHVVQDEHVGEFSYMSIYVPVVDEEGHEYAYLNIPYLNSQRELNQEISSFLVTLINLNAFIFVLAGAIALMVTYRITNSFILIGNKMKEVKLGKANEEISWNSKDEIGALVDEYNKMVKKLENSAHSLAKSEREGAWREMARQVAHEIKNPLTPMKLSIQYLQRSIAENKPDMKTLAQKVATTLVEQIDQLAKIASDFSQFANIGNIKMERFDVRDSIASLVNLYSHNEKYSITYLPTKDTAVINGDKTQIARLFTNLIQNGIEASEGKTQHEIIIEMRKDDNKLLISVKDNGFGIPTEKQDKIFNPNFTTKTSGTGLGLAMCKGIVEKANGKIWFETTEGEGSKFYVLLPLLDLPA